MFWMTIASPVRTDPPFAWRTLFAWGYLGFGKCVAARAPQPAREGACAPRKGPRQPSRSDFLLDRKQLLKSGIITDWGPHRIDFQARDGTSLPGRDREKPSQNVHCFRG